MSRRHRAEKRHVEPDMRYSSPLVAHLVNIIMKSGKKSIAQRIVYGAFEKVSEKLEKGDPVDLLLGALENARPRLEVKSRRVGGATYQVPVEVRPRRASTLSIRWVVGFSRARREKTMAQRLANEVMDAANGLGASVKRRDDMQKMAESNKAYAHYRW